MSLDGTDYSVFEQELKGKRPLGPDGRRLKWNPKWYSHKFEGPGVRYETAINIQTGDIVWTYGPFPAGKWADTRIFNHKLRHNLEDDEMVEADSTYMGMPYDVRMPHNYVNVADQIAKSQALARHETIHRRFKQFGCLGSRFRHDLKLHKLMHQCCVSLVQLSISRREMIFYVYY